jgi:hypothetical protein
MLLCSLADASGFFQIVLDSDLKEFGGWARLDPAAEFHTSEGWHDNRPHSFQVRDCLADILDKALFGQATGGWEVKNSHRVTGF